MEFGGESAERNEAVSNWSASLGVLAVVMTATLVFVPSSSLLVNRVRQAVKQAELEKPERSAREFDAFFPGLATA